MRSQFESHIQTLHFWGNKEYAIEKVLFRSRNSLRHVGIGVWRIEAPLRPSSNRTTEVPAHSDIGVGVAVVIEERSIWTVGAAIQQENQVCSVLTSGIICSGVKLIELAGRRTGIDLQLSIGVTDECRREWRGIVHGKRCWIRPQRNRRSGHKSSRGNTDLPRGEIKRIVKENSSRRPGRHWPCSQ